MMKLIRLLYFLNKNKKLIKKRLSEVLFCEKAEKSGAYKIFIKTDFYSILQEVYLIYFEQKKNKCEISESR